MIKGTIFETPLNIKKKNCQKLNFRQISAICTKWTFEWNHFFRNVFNTYTLFYT